MTPNPIRHRLSGVLVAAALAVGLCASCGSSDSTAAKGKEGLTPFRVVLDWSPNTNHGGMYLAEAKGWYRDAGLDVTFVQPGDADPLQLLAAGKADVAVSVQEALIPARAHDLPVVSIGAIIQHNTSGLISLSSDHIQRPRDLEGKTYGGYGGELETALIDRLVECDGGDGSKVETVQVGEADFRIGLQRNQYDTVWIFDGWDGIRLRDIDGVDLNEIDFADHTDCIPDWYTPLLATSESMEREHPDQLKAFMAATSKGYQRAMQDPGASARSLLDAAPDLDRELVTKSARYLSTRYADDPKAWGRQDAHVWRDFARFLEQAGIVDDAGDVSKAWTNRFLPKAR